MTNNKLTDEFLEKLIATGTYALDEGFIRISDDSELMAMARELQEYRKAESEHIYQVQYANGWQDVELSAFEDHVAHGSPVRIVYTTPQPAPAVEAVPDDALTSVISEIVELYDDDRGFAEHMGVELGNKCRAAMQQPVSNRDELPGWIKYSERIPPIIPDTSIEYLVYETLNNRVTHDHWYVPEGNKRHQAFWSLYHDSVTHWMLLPAAPRQEDRK